MRPNLVSSLILSEQIDVQFQYLFSWFTAAQIDWLLNVRRYCSWHIFLGRIRLPTWLQRIWLDGSVVCDIFFLNCLLDLLLMLVLLQMVAIGTNRFLVAWKWRNASNTAKPLVFCISSGNPVLIVLTWDGTQSLKIVFRCEWQMVGYQFQITCHIIVVDVVFGSNCLQPICFCYGIR